MTEVLLAGNSHIVALRTAAHRRGGVRAFLLGHGRYETASFSERSGAGVRLTAPDYQENLHRSTGLATITPGQGAWGFLLVNHTARIYQHPCWRRFEPAAVARKGCHPVSEAAVHAMVVEDHSGVRAFFEQLRDAGVDFFAISGPPPRRDHHAIAEGTRPEVVQHLDRFARGVWASWLAAAAIDVIDPPQESVDDEGFLLPQYARERMRNGERDPHHANEQYGDLMITKIQAYLGCRV